MYSTLLHKPYYLLGPKAILLFGIFICISSYGQSFEPILTKIDDDITVPDQEIYGLIQSEDGLFWLATNSGLYSYDGREFVHHQHKEQIGESVFNLNIDDDGNMWYNNFVGQVFCKYKDIGETVVVYKRNKKIGFKPLEKSRLGMLIFGENSMILHQANRSDTIDHFEYLHPCSNVINKENHSLFWRGDSLYQIIGKDCVALRGYSNLPEARTIKLFSLDNQIFIYLSSYERNYVFDITTSSAVERTDLTELTNISMTKIIQRGSFVWFLTGGGALRYEYKDGQFQLVEHLLDGVTVTDLLIDQDGFRLLSTLDRGLYVLPYRQSQKLKLPYVENRQINKMIQYNDSVLYFIADQNTLHRYNVMNDQYLSKDVFPYHVQNIIVNPYANDLFLFSGGLVSKLDMANLSTKWTKKADVPKQLVALNKDQYLGAYYFGARFWKKGFSDNSENVVTNTTRAHSLAVAENKTEVYVSFHDRFSLCDTALQEEALILLDEKKWVPNLLTVQPKSDVVWAAKNDRLIALDSGMIIYEKDFKVQSRSDYIRSIVADTAHLFIAYRDRIQALNYEDNTFYNFPYYPFLKKAIVKEIQLMGEWLIVNTGADIFRIPKLHFTEIPKMESPDLYIKKVSINSQIRPIKGSYHLSQEEEDRITLEVALNKVFTNDRFKFQYRWNNESSWQSFPEASDVLVLDNIPSGRNELAIRSFVKINESTTDPVLLHIYRAYPWWRQWWFYTLVALGIGGVSFLIFWRINRRKQVELQLKLENIFKEREMVSLQLENLRSQMNPHFVFNALNSIQDYIVGNERRLASKFLVKFSRLIRLYLEHSRTAQISVEEEIEALQLYLELEKDRFEKSLHYQLIVDPSLPIKQLYIPSLLLQPYVENAINHGLLHKEGYRNLCVMFKRSNELLVCTIEDNGIGRTIANQLRTQRNHTSFSTKANADRIALINRNLNQKLDVTIEDLFSEMGDPAGTKVYIKIPFQNENHHN